MDPASAFIGVVSGAASLIAMSVQTVTILASLKDSFENIQLLIWDLLVTCQAFESSWKNIHSWALNAQKTQQQSVCTVALDELLSHVEFSKVVLDLLRKDLDRLKIDQKPAPRLLARPRRLRSRLGGVLHEKIIRDHCDRMNRQINSLHLLLATVKLRSNPLQEVIVQALQPVFRKDEESAWTIVRSRWSTAVCSSMAVSGRDDSSIFSNEQTTASLSQRFAFENELIVGPVYKRLLYTRLCGEFNVMEKRRQRSTAPVEIVSPLDPNAETELNLQTDQTTGRSSVFELEVNDMEIENINRILQEEDGFSIDCFADLKEIRNASDPYSLPSRNLPISYTLRRHQLTDAEQKQCDEKILSASAMMDIDSVAEALSEGANINATNPSTGETPLQSMLVDPSRWNVDEQFRTFLAFLLLYRDTFMHRIRRANSIQTLLENGEFHILNRLAAKEDFLQPCNKDGDTPLHFAARTSDILNFRILVRIFLKKGLSLNEPRDLYGGTVLRTALRSMHKSHVWELLLHGARISAVYPTDLDLFLHVFSRSTKDLELAELVEAGSDIRCTKSFDIQHGLQHGSYMGLLKYAVTHQKSDLACALLCVHKLNLSDFQSINALPEDFLREAVEKGEGKILLRLLGCGYWPEKDSINITLCLGALEAVEDRTLLIMAQEALPSHQICGTTNDGFHLTGLNRPVVWGGSEWSKSCMHEILGYLVNSCPV